MEQPFEAGPSAAPAIWNFAGVRFDEARAKLCVRGHEVDVDRSSQALLSHFLRHAGELVPKDTLLDVGWSGRIVAENTLAKAISRLRQLIGDEQCQLLRVVHGYGYRLVAAVEHDAAVPAVAEASTVAAEATGKAPAATTSVAAPGIRGSRVLLLIDAVVLLAVVAIGAVGFVALPTHPGALAAAQVSVPAAGSIAILPFADLSPAQDQAYFADGLADELLDHLSRLPQLRVVSRTSSFAYRGKQVDLPSIGRALNAETVLEGSVRTSAERIRITVQLIKTADGFHVWSQTYDRPITELFAMQDEIAKAIVDALQIELLPEQARALVQHGTANPEAYRQYLLGNHTYKDDETGGRRSLLAFRRAVALDPDYIDAWRSLADTLGYMGLYADSAEEALAGKREARAIIDRMIVIAPQRGDLYQERAEPRYAQWWDWQGAEQDLEQAAKLGVPDESDRLVKLARLRAATGRLDEALALTSRASQLDPKTGSAFTVRGYHLIGLGRYYEARRSLQQALHNRADDEHAQYYLGLVELLQGHTQQALANFDDSAHVLRLTGQAIGYYTLGDQAASEHALQLLVSRYGFLVPYQMAEVYAWRGEPDKAFEWLQHATELRDASFMYLAFDPLLDNIRGDPRFAALMTQVGQPGLGLRSMREGGAH